MCSACPKGFYCTGDGLATPCQGNATTLITASASTDCVCNPGYFYSVLGNEAVCRPCNRKSYKPNVGNGDCPLTCPANADSELASIALADCFCEPQFYASVDATGQLARCIPCTFEGLGCRGGFENATNGTQQERVHALPIALCLVNMSLKRLAAAVSDLGLASTRRASPRQWPATCSCLAGLPPAWAETPASCSAWEKQLLRAALAPLEPWTPRPPPSFRAFSCVWLPFCTAHKPFGAVWMAFACFCLVLTR